MALPQKDPLQMNPQKNQFTAILQAMPLKSDIPSHHSACSSSAGIAKNSYAAEGYFYWPPDEVVEN